ncbi:MAG: serine/threonine-protein phosphatase [Clostridia bacterium]|nr:serine/threonine-protein phosphatase [Clostridia bacterium]
MVEYSVYTNIGSREINEDAVKAITLDGNFGFIVCDGLGGQGMGDKASKIVTDCYNECFINSQINESFLPKTFERAQSTLLEEKKKLNAKNQMCTTAVALAINENTAYIAHIGDSRLYFFEGDNLIYKTLDHSLPQMLALQGEIKEEDIAHHPDRNKLLRAFGTEWDKPMYAIADPITLNKNQAFLLCTDGIWEWITDAQLSELLKISSSAEEWLEKIIDAVEISSRNNEHDNYSAIAVFVK